MSQSDKQATACGSALTEMEVKARDLSRNGGLRSYLVVLREMKANPKGELIPMVRSLCFTAPSWSHVAAKYDRPEDGVEIMKQEFLSMGEVSVLPLAWKSEMAEITDMNGLNMCYACQNDFRLQPNNRCTLGHRTDGSKAETPCVGFKPKVK